MSTIYIIKSIRINERTPVVRRLDGHFLVMKMKGVKFWQLRRKYDVWDALRRGTLNLWLDLTIPGTVRFWKNHMGESQHRQLFPSPARA